MPKTNNGKDYYYFEHQTKSRNDVKLLRLDEYLGEHVGYAMFFKALEVMTELVSPYLEKGKLMYAKAMGVSLAEYDRFVDCAISSGLFDVATDGSVYSPGYLKWLAIKNHAKEAGSKGGLASAESKANAKANSQAKEPAKPKAKTPHVAKSAITESEEIVRLRGYANEILKDFADCKHAKNTLTGAQYQTLLDKYGMAKLTVMQRIYFGWKASRAKAPTTTDFGTLNVTTGWVSEKADEKLSAGQSENRTINY